jgi:hypothetical protein
LYYHMKILSPLQIYDEFFLRDVNHLVIIVFMYRFNKQKTSLWRWSLVCMQIVCNFLKQKIDIPSKKLSSKIIFHSLNYTVFFFIWHSYMQIFSFLFIFLFFYFFLIFFFFFFCIYSIEDAMKVKAPIKGWL